MKKIIALIVLGWVQFAMAERIGSDPILSFQWDLEGSTLTFGRDSSYADRRHGAYGTYTVTQPLSGTGDTKIGNIDLLIDRSSDSTWKPAAYFPCPVVVGRSDRTHDVSTTKTTTSPDPDDPTKTITTDETTTTKVKDGNNFTLNVTCPAGTLSMTREDNNTKSSW